MPILQHGALPAQTFYDDICKHDKNDQNTAGLKKWWWIYHKQTVSIVMLFIINIEWIVLILFKSFEINSVSYDTIELISCFIPSSQQRRQI